MEKLVSESPAQGSSWVWRYLPRGSTLPEDVWLQRHRGVLVLLWLHVPVVLTVAVAQDVGLLHAGVETGIVAAFATLASASREFRRLSTVWLGRYHRRRSTTTPRRSRSRGSGRRSTASSSSP